jgi:hypothetical protein
MNQTSKGVSKVLIAGNENKARSSPMMGLRRVEPPASIQYSAIDASPTAFSDDNLASRRSFRRRSSGGLNRSIAASPQLLEQLKTTL